MGNLNIQDEKVQENYPWLKVLLSSFPNSKVTVEKKDIKKFLLENNGDEVLIQYKSEDVDYPIRARFLVISKHLAAGVYTISLKHIANLRPRAKIDICGFERAYDSNGCQKKPMSEGHFCEEHSKVKCCVCSDQATHECSYASQFVCGYPLCDKKECHSQHKH